MSESLVGIYKVTIHYHVKRDIRKFVDENARKFRENGENYDALSAAVGLRTGV